MLNHVIKTEPHQGLVGAKACPGSVGGGVKWKRNG